jgi:hypothetical protein
MEGSMRKVQNPRFYNSQPLPRELRDRNERHKLIYPYSLQEHHGNQEVQRTAGVKHHLRRKCRTPDKISTYNHDYTYINSENVDKQLSDDVRSARSVKSMATRSVRSTATTGSKGPRLPGTQPVPYKPELRQPVNEHDRLRFEDEGDRYYAHGDTFQRLRGLGSTGRPVQITCTGWGDTKWSPAHFPELIKGESERRNHLVQTIQTLNLRSKDLLNVIH